MGKGKTRKFIDKNDKGTYSFMLVPRSQRDPKAVDSESSQYVLQPMFPPNSRQDPDALLPEDLDEGGVENDDDAMMAMMMGGKKKEDLEKYGIFYKDEYDYMQHLAPRGHDDDIMLADEKALQEELTKRGTVKPKNVPLDASLFASAGEEKVGLLNRVLDQNTLHLDWDPEVIAALDDDEVAVDAENVKEDASYDDFFDQVINSENQDLGSDGGDFDFDEDDRDQDFDDEDFEEHQFEGDEGEESQAKSNAHLFEEGDSYEDMWRKIGHGRTNTDVMDLHRGLRPEGEGMTEVRSKFTEYSMTSSIVPRSENLQNVDDHFEEFYDNYDEENIGALDLNAEDDDVVGDMDGDTLEGMLAELSDDLGSKMTLVDVVKEAQQRQQMIREEQKKSKSSTVDNEDAASEGTIDAEEMKNMKEVEEEGEEEEVDDEILNVAIEPAKKLEWDCESILSTRSTLYNHPTVISEKSRNSKNKKKKQQNEIENNEEEEEEEEEELSNEESDGEEVSTIRKKNETKEEKKKRKAQIKEERRRRREEKKMHKLAFKQELQRQQRL